MPVLMTRGVLSRIGSGDMETFRVMVTASEREDMIQLSSTKLRNRISGNAARDLQRGAVFCPVNLERVPVSRAVSPENEKFSALRSVP